MENELETRLIEATDVEIRAGDGTTPPKLVGYPIVWNSLSEDLGGFKERVMPGATRASISNNQDIRALVDHDPSKLLGRTSNGTLRLAEDDKGLRMEVDLPDTTYARDVQQLVARRDIRGMSFGFKVPKEGQRFTKEGGQTIRELHNINLREVTVTSIPAYGGTSIQVRVDPNIAGQIADAEKNLFPELTKCRAKLNTTLARG